MAELDRFLRYLGREDVSELLLQTGKVAAIRIGNEMRPLTQKPLASSQIVALLATAGLSEHVPSQDTAGAAINVETGTGKYDMVVARHGSAIQLRIARGGTWTGGAGRARPQEPAVPERAPAQKTKPRDVGIYDPNALDLSVGKPEAARHPTAPDDRSPSKPATRTAQRAQQTRAARDSRPAPSRARPVKASTQLIELLGHARSQDASDLHVSSENEARIRRAGRLSTHGPKLSDATVRQMLEPLLDDRRRAQFAEFGYADFALDLDGIGRVRININRQQTGLKGCFRLIAREPSTLEELGLPAELAKVTKFHQGLAIVSGPNGQGKTTTMASLVDMINATRPFHIITVEDPVEFIHPIKKAVLSQRQVGDHTDSFQTALKGSLREDPDVIVIGELRDRETVEMALAAAETGHLVIATMSTPSGAKTIDRMINMFPPDDQQQVRATLAGALKIIVSLRLVPSVDGTRLHAAAELITGGLALWTLIRDNKLFQLPSLLQRGRAYGMIRIEDSLSELVKRGLISVETAQANADDPRLIQTGEQSAGVPEPREVPGSLRSFFTRKG